MTDVAVPSTFENELNSVVTACLSLDKQNANRLRDVGAFFDRAAQLPAGESSYAVEVSKPGNLRKQLEQSGRARRSRIAVAIFDETEHSADAYVGSAQSVVTSDAVAARAVALVVRREGTWKLVTIVSADDSGEADALHRLAASAEFIRAGRKSVAQPSRSYDLSELVKPTEAPLVETRLLDDRVRRALLSQYREMLAAGDLRDRPTLQRYYDTFAKRFGPDALATVQGEALAELMHDHGNRQSLVYWIEFKNDEEFPGIFGSIAGGSALKFGLFRRAASREWAVPGDDRSGIEVPLATAVSIAGNHREQLTAAAEVLSRLPEGVGEADYSRLQDELNNVAQGIADSAWGHKYLSLMFPSRLEDFHVVEYQRYHLMRMLQPSSSRPGRYVNAWRYVVIARELEMPLNHLTSVLVRRNGRPRQYWRIGTSDGTAPRNQWDMMRTRSVVAVGWPKIGDIGPLRELSGARDEVRKLLQEHYALDKRVGSRKAGEISDFLRLDDGDIVCAADGGTILGIGTVRGPYVYDPDSEFPHQRLVEWHTTGEWKAVEPEGLQTTVWHIKDENLQIQIESVLLEAPLGRPRNAGGTSPEAALPPAAPLSGVARRVEQILDRKGQVVLYGPPGTGKTHHALSAAREIVARRVFGKPFSELTADQRRIVEGGPNGEPGLVRTTTFHPEYGYENFIEGYHPTQAGGQLSYQPRDGIFKAICLAAAIDPAKRPHVLVIDEINRGDIPRIFGELLTLLERDKRGKIVQLPLEGKPFAVPERVYVIGTMNTADRSIALLDVALRRRFGFVALMPDYEVLGSATVAGLPLAKWLRWVNSRVRQMIGGDGRHREIGHGYFWNNGAPVQSPDVLAGMLRDDIVPLLEDYFFEDLGKLESILGSVIVDLDEQRIRYEVFDGDPESAIAAVLEAAPELEAETAAEIEQIDDDDSTDDDDDSKDDDEAG